MELSIKRLAPVARLTAFACFIGSILLFNHPAVSCLFLGTIIATARFSGVLWVLRRFRAMILGFSLFSAVTWTLTVGGTRVFVQWYGIKITQEALGYGFAMGLRLGTLAAAGLLFSAIMSPTDLHGAMLHLGVPYRVAFTFSLSLALFESQMAIASDIVEAQTARGLDLGTGGLPERAKKYLSLAVPLVMAAVRKTHLLAIGLESRCFSPQCTRLPAFQRKLDRRDYAALVLAICVFGLLVGLRLHGVGSLTQPR